MSRKVLSAGATGIPARASVRKAIALGLKVRAMVRKADERSEALAGQGAEVVLGDLFDINSLRFALEGVEAAYFVYPVAPNLLAATVNFAQAAKEAGTKAVLNLSQRSQNRHSTSHSCRDLHRRASIQLVRRAGGPSAADSLSRVAALSVATQLALLEQLGLIFANVSRA